MTPLLLLLLALFLLALLPLRLTLHYDEDGPSALAHAGPVPFRIYPPKEKTPKETAKIEEKEKETEKDDARGPAEKKGGSLALIKAALPLLTPALAGLKRRLTILSLALHITWAASDPAGAAMGYGYAQAILGTLWPLIDNNFRVKRRQLDCSVDFDARQPTVYLHAVLTLRLYQIVTLALPLLIRFALAYRKEKAAKSGEIRKKEA